MDFITFRTVTFFIYAVIMHYTMRYFFRSILNEKKNNCSILLHSYIWGLSIFIAYTSINSEQYWRTGLIYILNYIFQVLFFEKDIMRRIYALIVLLFSNIISNLLATLIFAVVSPEIIIIDSMDSHKVTGVDSGIYVTYALFSFTGLIIQFAILLLVSHFQRNGRTYLPHRAWRVTFVISFMLIPIMMYLLLDYSHVLGDNAEARLPYVIILSAVLLCIMAYFILYFAGRYFRKKNEVELLKLQNEMFEKYLLDKKEADERIGVLSHDLKHSLVQWRLLAEEKGNQDILKNISAYEKQLEMVRLIHVNHEAADTIVNQKLSEAKKKHVSLSIDGVFESNLRIERLDICSLLGNLLDNGLEAAEKVTEEKLRYVRLSIRNQGNLLLLVLENGYQDEPVLKGRGFQTSKAKKEIHGFGMLSIRHIVSKYDGTMEIQYQNNIYKQTMVLRAYPMTEANITGGNNS